MCRGGGGVCIGGGGGGGSLNFVCYTSFFFFFFFFFFFGGGGGGGGSRVSNFAIFCGAGAEEKWLFGGGGDWSFAGILGALGEWVRGESIKILGILGGYCKTRD